MTDNARNKETACTAQCMVYTSGTLYSVYIVIHWWDTVKCGRYCTLCTAHWWYLLFLQDVDGQFKKKRWHTFCSFLGLTDKKQWWLHCNGFHSSLWMYTDTARKSELWPLHRAFCTIPVSEHKTQRCPVYTLNLGVVVLMTVVLILWVPKCSAVGH